MIKEHGLWEQYTPDELPAGAPTGAVFVRRLADSKDWYEYVNDNENFDTGTIKMTVVDDTVRAAYDDATKLFPVGALVLEDTTTTPSPVGKVYDPNTKTLSDPPVVEAVTATARATMTDILRRLKILEGRKA